MTIQLPKVDTTDPHLLSDNSKYSSTSDSFDDLLNYAKAKLGLPFSPLAQLGGFFAYPDLFTAKTDSENNWHLTPDYNGLSQQAAKTSTSTPDPRLPAQDSPLPHIFESVSTQPFSRQLLQELLTKTNWLVPNLSAQPFFAKALTAGKFLPSLDLQFLIDEIVKQVQIIKENGRTELSLSLKLAELGEVFVKLSSLAGAISVQIMASPEAKKLIADQRPELERALKKAKLHITEVRIEEVPDNV